MQLSKLLYEFGKIEEIELCVLPYYSDEAMEMLPEFIVLVKIQIHSSNLKLLKSYGKILKLAYKVYHLDKRKIYLYDIFNELSIKRDQYIEITKKEALKSSMTKTLLESKRVLLDIISE